MMPLVSVIIPIYNVEKYLEKCINSVINQEYTNLEIILVNDGSKDKSICICNKYAIMDTRIRIINKENGGLSTARNSGLDIATGDYIIFVDSDDWIEKEMIKVLVEHAIIENADIVQCGFNYINELNIVERTCVNKNITFNNNESILNSYFSQEIVEVVVWNKLYRKILFNQIRMVEGKNNEDTMMMPEILFITNKFVNIEKAYYNYLKRENSIMSSEFNIKKLDSIFACEYVIELCKEKRNQYSNNARIILCMVCIYLYNDFKGSSLKNNKEIQNKILTSFYENYKRIKNTKEFENTRIKNRILIESFGLSKKITIILYRLYNKLNNIKRSLVNLNE